LSGVLYSKDISSNIISIPQLIKHGCTVSFENEYVYVKKDGKIVCMGSKHPKTNLYVLKSHSAVTQVEGMVAVLKSSNEMMRILHNRFAHLNHADIIRISKENLALGVPVINGYPHHYDCPHCRAGKATREPYPKKIQLEEEENMEVCDEVNSDTFGPISPKSCYNHVYIIIFVDHGSCFTILIGMTSLDQVYECYAKV